MITEFLMFGGVFFWLFVGIVSLIVVAFYANDEASSATVSILLAMGALALFSNFNPFVWLWENPITSVLWLAAYVAVGVVWSVVKWRFLLSKILHLAQSLREKYDADEAQKWKTETSFIEHRLAYDHSIHCTVPPKAATFKTSIYCWLFYWPLSFIGTMIDNPLRNAMTWIYNRVTTSFDRMSGKAFADFDSKS